MKAKQFTETYNPGISEFCSAVIDSQGDITACQVSHLKTMIGLYGDQEVLAEIPAESSPLFWLVNKLQCVLVDYENQVYSGELTPEQEQALNLLAEKGLIQENRKNIHGHC